MYINIERERERIIREDFRLVRVVVILGSHYFSLKNMMVYE